MLGLYTVALIIVLFLNQGEAATSICQVQRNATHIVLQCETDQLQIIWRVGDNPDFEPEYNVNGSIVIAITTIPLTLTGNITVTCIGKSRNQNGFTSENDTFIVTVIEGSTTPPPSGTVPSSNNISTESTTPPVPSNNTTTDYGSMATPTTPTTENGTVVSPTCGPGCIAAISVAALVVVWILLAIPILYVCWKKKKPRCATLCSDVKNATPQQPGRNAVPETDPSCSGSAVMVNGHPKSLTGPGTNHNIPVYVTTGIDEGEDRKVEFVTPISTWRRLPHSLTDRPSVTNDLTSTSNINAIPVNENGVQHFPYESGTAAAHICILMESTKDKDCS